MTQRTKISFRRDADVWPVVEGWAGGAGFHLKETTGPERLYQKGTGFLVAPMMLSIRQADGQVAMEAWIRCNTFVRLMSLFILPAEMGIESGGFKGVAPRAIARKAVNQLLPQLGQPPIP